MNIDTKCRLVGFIAGTVVGEIWAYLAFVADPLQPGMTRELLMLMRGFFWGIVGLVGGKIISNLIARTTINVVKRHPDQDFGECPHEII